MKKSKSFTKLTAWALTLAFIFALVPALTTPASAENAEDLAAAITSYGDGGGTGSFTTNVSGSTVTVTGSVTGATKPLDLNIDAGVTVVWQAEFSGMPAYSSEVSANCLIGLTGDGTFRVVQGGSIEATSAPAGACAIKIGGVSGIEIDITSGIVSVTGSSDTFAVRGPTSGSIKVSGGLVSAIGGADTTAIRNDYGTGIIIVSGGRVIAESTTGGSSRALYGDSGGVTVSGGEVLAIGGTTNRAVYFDASDTLLTLSGGLLFGHGSTVSNITHNADISLSGGTLAAYDNSNTGPFIAGSPTSLDSNPLGSVTWARDRDNKVGGVRYGSPTSFFTVIPGITVIDVPTVPRNFSATPGDEQAALSWTDPADDGDRTITHYEISTDNFTNIATITSLTNVTLTGLTNGTAYTFYVRAVNSVGAGPTASATATPSTSIGVPGAPRNLTAAPGDRQVGLSWTAPADDGGSTITHYEVSTDNFTSIATSTSLTNAALTGLTNGTEYTFYVRAVNSAGAGPAASANATPSGDDNGGGGNGGGGYGGGYGGGGSYGGGSGGGSTVSQTAPAPPPKQPEPQQQPEAPAPTHHPRLTDEHIAYLSGYPDGSVRPDNSITRAEAAMIFFRLIEDENKEAPRNADFSDLSGGEWYYRAVAYLQRHGIITGYPDGSFRPDKPITRAEFAAISSRFDDLEADAENIFGDVPETHWAVGYINSAVKKGWVSGFPDNSFRPDENITRAQVVTIVNRMLDRKIKVEDIPESVTTFTDIEPTHWAYTAIVEASVTHEFTRKDDGNEIWT